MDDFNMTTLGESRNEYCAMLVSRLTPQIIQGMYSIFNEAVTLCKENDEEEKYLMTFQNFLQRVPKWNQDIVEKETERIIQTTSCSYLEDLLTCVHITQLKVLTSMRAGNKQKKIEIDIPKLSIFIHRVYIETSRKLYKNVFLFEQNTFPLQKQKNMREFELIVKECILNVIRDSMPLEHILKSYLDESTEENADEIREEVRDEFEEMPEPVVTSSNNDSNNNDAATNASDEYENTKNISFNNTDSAINYNNTESSQHISNESQINIEAPKNIDRLEEISNQRWEQRRLEEEDESDDDEEYYSDDSDDRINIMNDTNIKLDQLDIQTIDKPIHIETENLLGDVELLN